MKLTIIESPYRGIKWPYRGDIDANVEYARECMHDSLMRGEAPIASHLLYTQPGILCDEIPEERALGIAAGLAWRKVAELWAFYVDRGWSPGMVDALQVAIDERRAFEIRNLYPLHHEGKTMMKSEHADVLLGRRTMRKST